MPRTRTLIGTVAIVVRLDRRLLKGIDILAKREGKDKRQLWISRTLAVKFADVANDPKTAFTEEEKRAWLS